MLLSVGYAACHWCHVMAHESFEDPTIAALMNERFVSVKVDREERPDVDAVYMDAVTAMTGHGGWPMTVFLTPEGEPFYAGTYFPPRRRGEMPGFPDVLIAVSGTWRERSDDVRHQASEVLRRIEQMRAVPRPTATAPPTSGRLCRGRWPRSRRQYDYARGGFGAAPKFPPSMVLEFLTRHHARTGSSDALLMAEGTLRAMAVGGIYDQLAGGFARYSVDSGWVVPHFEKMLYDNALLARVALHIGQVSGRELGGAIADETADFLVADLRHRRGWVRLGTRRRHRGRRGAVLRLDAEELVDVLGAEDGEWAADLLEVTAGGHVRARRVDAAAACRAGRRRPMAAASARAAGSAGRTRTAPGAGRQGGHGVERPRGRRTRRDRRRASAVRTWWRLLLGAPSSCGTCTGPATGSCGCPGTGSPGVAHGVLEDYAATVEGWLVLYQVSGDARWYDRALGRAGRRADRLRRRVGAATSTPRPTPSSSSAARRSGPTTPPRAASRRWPVRCSWLRRSAASPVHREAAERLLAAAAAASPVAAPRFAGWWLAVAEAWIDGPREVAVVVRRAERAGTRSCRRRGRGRRLVGWWPSARPGDERCGACSADRVERRRRRPGSVASSVASCPPMTPGRSRNCSGVRQSDAHERFESPAAGPRRPSAPMPSWWGTTGPRTPHEPSGGRTRTRRRRGVPSSSSAPGRSRRRRDRRRPTSATSRVRTSSPRRSATSWPPTWSGARG